MKKIIVLGSSGSIGTQTLDIAANMKDSISIAGLSVHSNIELLKKQIIKFKPTAVCVGELFGAQKLQAWLKEKNLKTKVFFGHEGLNKLVAIYEADTVVVAIVGAAGLDCTIKAIKAKKNIAVANKETLVVAGREIMKLAVKNKVSVLPVDSEHSAIFQCLNCGKKSEVKRILLTASGGPFYKYNKDFSKITVEDALAHPTWKMGKKITIDSATLMNKGLEAIEASVLFDVPIDKIEIVIHPQSIVHSMVEFADGSVIAQLSNPDMRLPIQYALTYPDRKKTEVKALDLAQTGKLEFLKPNFKKFPCLNIAYKAAKKGLTYPAALNGANEEAVAAFLDKKIKFTDIAKIVEKTVNAHKPAKKVSIDACIAANAWARVYSRNLIHKGKNK
ncbi:1-deoxy-D-xylulose-5-phosphate reductoisomerase [Endomicrobium proavitum]|uniref:1-deoxy-D-xylulose 5-phosphate reductoisomerase n=1 Tax=Endomicrobium proavitum TaxID=1408281 RepID=A0A0G3WJI0_9BACT|nr:1-deoxy-D-xylulose-5-phosphate reductoisomerase [Endomicrobium proavitum]AKL97654.1 1-deoxy-D-xylulose 5-phosphate reductoisomerase [Endomicrobium proavitum]